MSSGATWTESDLAVLKNAKNVLENPGFAAKATNLIGVPIEKGMEALPDSWRDKIGASTNKALQTAIEVATKTIDEKSRETSSDWWHKVAVGTSGALGGAFGLPALAIELPISTTIMLRSIADIARSEGEKVDDIETQLSCIEVFALGGRSETDDSQESAYFAVRAALAKSVTEAATFIAERGLAEEGAPAVARFIAAVATRFGVTVSEKAAAMAVPIIGAAGGAIINVLFIDHFQDMAHGHFAVRKLERKYGKDSVRLEYDRV